MYIYNGQFVSQYFGLPILAKVFPSVDFEETCVIQNILFYDSAVIKTIHEDRLLFILFNRLVGFSKQNLKSAHIYIYNILRSVVAILAVLVHDVVITRLAFQAGRPEFNRWSDL